ncbi:MAG: DNA mismatch repair protein MutS [Deltaproteobacteria bacterium]|nr:DNA mismatch repair protein MutS [Deltaproteobacteria bacterium]
MNSQKTTPMMQQYLSIKERYSDAILFYRMGDFYEMFFEDAEKASRILEITLTSRNRNAEFPIPMCGIPYKAAQTYLAKLINKGYKVAICDQIEKPSDLKNESSKRLVKRDVVRVLTPGMILDDDLLDEKTNNYILSLSLMGDQTGIAYLDISTGAFRVSESDDFSAIVEEIRRVAPSEAILPKDLQKNTFFSSITTALQEKAITFLETSIFEYQNCRDRLNDQFKTISLEGFGCEELKAGVSAAGALVHYVRETQKQETVHLSGIETYRLDNFLLIDDLTCRNLELVENLGTGKKRGSLLGILDSSNTAMGARMLKRWLMYPLLDIDQIRSRQEAIEEAIAKKNLSLQIRGCFKSVYDLERLDSKIAMGRANARDLTALKRSLKSLPEIGAYLAEFNSNLLQPDQKFQFDDLADLLEKAIREDAPPIINEGGIIKAGFNAELDELISISRDGKGWLARLEVKEKEATGINSLKVKYNKVFGYFIEVPKSRSESVPPNYIRKQTLVNAERFITDELKKFEFKVMGAQEKRASLEYEIFTKIKNKIIKYNQQINNAAQFIARLDTILTLALIADENEYTKPEINTKGNIIIEDGRHPVVEKMITGERFVPNSININNDDSQVLIITGPNMAGKSTILRQTAIIVLMAQIGSFVPANKTSISITDRIFTRIGALDNLSAGHSTFMVEMQETANILNNATSNSLVIMDEIGRGTSTFDGLSIARAVAEFLHELKGKGVKTLFATHYHELTDLAQTKNRIKNYNIAVKEWNDEIIFLRKLVEGGTNKSYGIQVARLAGIPEKVINRAKKILSNIENGKNRLNVNKINAVKPQMREQLSLFPKKENKIIKKLQNLDISGTTPLEALNILNELQEKAKKVK